MQLLKKASKIAEALKSAKLNEYVGTLKGVMGASASSGVSVARRERFIKLEGEKELRVYTYDSRPLKGVLIGQPFYSEIDCDKPIRLQSTLNGNVYDSARDGGIVLSRGGVPFGVVWSYEDIFRRVMGKGYSFDLKVMLTGIYEAHIPTAIALVPRYKNLEAWIDCCDAIGKDMTFAEWEASDRIAIWLEEGQLKVPHLPIGYVQLSTEWLQAAKGSTAKPHIAVSIDGAVSTEVAAAQRCYKALSLHVGEKPCLASCSKFERSAEHDKELWKVEIMYASE